MKAQILTEDQIPEALSIARGVFDYVCVRGHGSGNDSYISAIYGKHKHPEHDCRRNSHHVGNF